MRENVVLSSVFALIVAAQCAASGVNHSGALAGVVLVVVGLFYSLRFARSFFGVLRLTALSIAVFCGAFLLVERSFPPFSSLHALDAEFDSEQQQSLRSPRSRSRVLKDLHFCGETTSFIRRSTPGRAQFFANGVVRDALGQEITNGKFQFFAPDLPWLDTWFLRHGSHICGRAEARLSGYTQSLLPEPFSYEAYLFRRGVIASGNFSELEHRGTRPGVDLKQRLVREVVSRFGSRESVAVLLAATLGVQDLLGEHQREVFRRTGTTHLLVVSGFHVGVVFAVIRFVLLFFFRQFIWFLKRYPAPLFASWGAFVGTSFYTLLVDGGVPCFRAIFILGVFVLAETFGRKSLSFRSLLVAGIVTLVFWPGAFFEAGWQLTFSALSGLFVARMTLVSAVKKREAEPEEEYEGSVRKTKWNVQQFFRNVCHSAVYCFYAWLFTSPVVLLWFSGVSFISPFVNMALIPVFSFLCVVCGGVVVFVFSLFPEVSGWSVEVVLYFVQWMVDAVSWVDGLFGGSLLGYFEVEGVVKERWVIGFVCGVGVSVLGCVGLTVVRSSGRSG